MIITVIVKKMEYPKYGRLTLRVNANTSFTLKKCPRTKLTIFRLSNYFKSTFDNKKKYDDFVIYCKIGKLLHNKKFNNFIS